MTDFTEQQLPGQELQTAIETTSGTDSCVAIELLEIGVRGISEGVKISEQQRNDAQDRIDLGRMLLPERDLLTNELNAAMQNLVRIQLAINELADRRDGFDVERQQYRDGIRVGYAQIAKIGQEGMANNPRTTSLGGIAQAVELINDLKAQILSADDEIKGVDNALVPLMDEKRAAEVDIKDITARITDWYEQARGLCLAAGGLIEETPEPDEPSADLPRLLLGGNEQTTISLVVGGEANPSSLPGINTTETAVEGTRTPLPFFDPNKFGKSAVQAATVRKGGVSVVAKKKQP